MRKLSVNLYGDIPRYIIKLNKRQGAEQHIECYYHLPLELNRLEGTLYVYLLEHT